MPFKISPWIRVAWFSCSTRDGICLEITLSCLPRLRLRTSEARPVCSLQGFFIGKQTFYSSNKLLNLR